MFNNVTSIFKKQPKLLAETSESKTYRKLSHEQFESEIESVLCRSGHNCTKTVRNGYGTTKHFEYKLYDYPIKINGDDCYPVINATNSLNKEAAVLVQFGLFRLVCLNGLTVGEVFEQIKFRHIVGENFEQCYDRIFTLLPIFLNNISDMVTVVEKTTSVKLTEIDIRRILFNLKLPKNVKAAAYDILISRTYNRYEDSYNTVWTVFNIINECIEKVCRSDKAKIKYNEKLLSNIVALAA